MQYNIKIISKGSEFILESEDREIIEREMDTYFAHLFEASQEFVSKIKPVVINKPVKSIEKFEKLSNDEQLVQKINSQNAAMKAQASQQNIAQKTNKPINQQPQQAQQQKIVQQVAQKQQPVQQKPAVQQVVQNVSPERQRMQAQVSNSTLNQSAQQGQNVQQAQQLRQVVQQKQVQQTVQPQRQPAQQVVQPKIEEEISFSEIEVLEDSLPDLNIVDTISQNNSANIVQTPLKEAQPAKKYIAVPQKPENADSQAGFKTPEEKPAFTTSDFDFNAPTKSVDELISIADEQIDLFDPTSNEVTESQPMFDGITVESDVPVEVAPQDVNLLSEQPVDMQNDGVLRLDDNLKDMLNSHSETVYSTKEQKETYEQNYQIELDSIFGEMAENADVTPINNEIAIENNDVALSEFIAQEPVQELNQDAIQEFAPMDSQGNVQDVLDDAMKGFSQTDIMQENTAELPIATEIDFELNEPQDLSIDFSSDSQEQIEQILQEQTRQSNDLKTLFERFPSLDSTQDYFLICAYYVKYALNQSEFTIKSVNSKLFQTTGTIADMIVVDELLAKEYISIIPCEDHKKYCITSTGEEFLSSRFEK